MVGRNFQNLDSPSKGEHATTLSYKTFVYYYIKT